MKTETQLETLLRRLISLAHPLATDDELVDLFEDGDQREEAKAVIRGILQDL